MPDKKEKTTSAKAVGRKKAVPDTVDVKVLAKEAGVPDWEMAGLMKAAGWAPGKHVSRDRFQAAVTSFRSRPQGGGRI